jgi:hypothetical protein
MGVNGTVKTTPTTMDFFELWDNPMTRTFLLICVLVMFLVCILKIIFHLENSKGRKIRRKSSRSKVSPRVMI